MAQEDNKKRGHLQLHFILDWSYSRQCLISGVDERRIRGNLLEQQEYALAVIRFYRDINLPYEVAVHHLIMTSGTRPTYKIGVGLIAMSTK